MALELLVTYDESGRWTDVLLWTMGEDPRLMEGQHFTDPADLRVWLKAITIEHGKANIRVRWTDRLKENRPLSHLLATCLSIPDP